MRRIIRNTEFIYVFSFAILLIATLFSRAFMHDALLTPIFNPAIGVAFGLLMIHGRKIYPSILSGFFLGHLLLHLYINPTETPFALISALGFLVIAFFEMEIGVWLIRRLRAFENFKDIRIRDAFLLFPVAGAMSLFAALLASGIYYLFQTNILSLFDIMVTIFFSHFLSIGIFGFMIRLNKDVSKRRFELNKTLRGILFITLYAFAIYYIIQDSSSFVFYRHNYMLVVFYILAAPLFSYLIVLLMTVILYLVSALIYLDSTWTIPDFYAEVYTLLVLGLISIMLSFVINHYLRNQQKASKELEITNNTLNMTLDYIQNLLQLSKNIGRFTDDTDVFAKKTYQLTESVFSDASALFAYSDQAGRLETKYSNHYSVKNIPGFYELHDSMLFNSEDVVVFNDLEASLKTRYGKSFLEKHPQFSKIDTRVYLIIRLKEKRHLIIGLDYFNDGPSLSTSSIRRMKELTRLLNQLFLKNHVVEQQSSLKDDIILTLVRTLDLYDKYTKGHGEVVARIAKTIAKELDLPKKEIDDIYLAGLLHDIGKLGVNHQVLNSENRLSDADYNAIKKHVDYGYQLISQSSPLSRIARIMREHHERVDGKGYPLGLDKDSISMGGKVLSVADAVATMASNRPYQMKKNFPSIIRELKAYKGTQFDPDVAEACMKLIKTKKLNPSE
ncbi:MAG: HD domain-containing phosphohydrolase [Bacillota bacterium]